MLLFRILLSFFVFTHINFLFSTDYKLKNIRFSDNHQSKSLRIVLDLTHKAPYTVFSLNNSPRLVIDLESKSGIKKFKNESSYIKNIRTRKTDKNVMRIVFDLNSNFYIDKHFYLKKNEKNIFRLVIDLKIDSNNSVLNREKKPRKDSNFIITIDAGHGGIDPGAINLGKKEKDITLKAAKELKKMLEKKNFKVFLTRKSDLFISLKKRREFHPDKLISKGLPEELIEKAQEKFIEIQEAYEELEKIHKK